MDDRSDVAQVDVQPPVRHVGHVLASDPVEGVPLDLERPVVVPEREIRVPVVERRLDPPTVLEERGARRDDPDLELWTPRADQGAGKDVGGVWPRIQPRDEDEDQ